MSRSFALFAAFLILTSVQLNAQVIHSLWMSSPVVMDGNPTEWPQPFRYYDGNTKLQFSFANDTGDIYVCVKITDDLTQMRLFRSGLNVWIDPKGKKKETICISFPTKGETNPEEGPGKRRSHDAMEEDPSAARSNILRLKQHASLQQVSLRVKGFTNVPEQVLPLKNNYGINVAFNWDSLNTLTIEYKFPAALVLGHTLAVSDTSKPIGIGFVEPAESVKAAAAENEGAIDMSKPTTGNMAGRNGYNNGMGGMGGGMNNRGGGMGGGGMSSAGSNPQTQEQKIWSKVILGWQ